MCSDRNLVRNFEYTIEQRGLDYQEDLFDPLVLTFDLNRNARPAIVASTELRTADSAEELRKAEVDRRQSVLAAAPSDDPFVRHWWRPPTSSL